MIPPKERFTSRVENYVKYRPHYPQQLLSLLRVECGIDSSWVIADVGSGTGISSELFLFNGNRVIGVEPNSAMREAGDEYLGRYHKFISIDGCAEQTNLPDENVDMIIAGSAFHWFDLDAAKVEFKRILKPGGLVALMWNSSIKNEPFMMDLIKTVKKYNVEHDVENKYHHEREKIVRFFHPNEFREFNLPNQQYFDFDGLIGRVCSMSYSPLPGHPFFVPMSVDLKKVFGKYSSDDEVKFEYSTNIYIGKIK